MLKVYFLKNDKVVVSEKLVEVKKGLIWIHGHNPSEEDLRNIEKKTGIPYENLSVALDDEVRPYAEKEDHLEIVYRAPIAEQGDVVTEPIAFFIKGRYIVTLSPDRVAVLSTLERNVQENKKKFLLRGRAGRFVHFIMDSINDAFLKRIDAITKTIDKVEEEPGAEKNFGLLYNASLTSAYFNRALMANIEVLNDLRKLYHRDITADDRDQFEDLYLEALQLLDTEKIQREIITNLFMFENVLANKKVERRLMRLTVLAVIIAVPTLISGIYGMNVALPLQDSPHAFWLVIGIMALLSGGFVALLKWFD